MRDNLPKMLRAAAKEWREKNKVVATGATRYDSALEEAADATEELQKLTDAQLDIIKQYQAYLDKYRWIPVTERLPEKNQIVVVVQHGKTWDYGQFRGLAYLGGNIHKWNWKNNTTKTVDYWMPKKSALPEPPKEET